ncbi:FadR/GntR family transcriptional regulator [Sphingomonas sp. BIUV-7]|uniref:FadR/GntR family transcriptional regulator n=1 Tax=Sphingomonas natans TaxID=3063330 RepID=A0ABT8YB54_9SPHN|nr:FadR/GntR family transcriptional regulator [Sphingomonas sp. BIUV-7]MDO6415567.1 FadR/GntR family transcriptional regulator [Sphingomonas sp. BIUV-7]
MNVQTGGKKFHGLPSHERLHTAVAREIAVAIVTGGYRPGETLMGENSASEALGVSRAAYREAIRTLMAKGLVESRPKTGTRVCPRARWNLLDPDVLGWILENDPAPEFLGELFELRLAIEPRLAELAAEHRSDQDLARMHAALADMQQHEPDSEAAEEADRRFHEALISAAGNELMGQLTSSISASVGYVARAKRREAAHRDSTEDHRLLLEAIEQADPVAARASTRRIIQRGLADLHLDR